MKINYADRVSAVNKYIFAEINKKVAALRASGKQIIDFGVGDPKAPPPQFVIDYLSVAADKRKMEGYPSYIGDPSFRQVCADYLKREYNVLLDPITQIASNIGSKEAIFHFPLGIINPGDLVICPNPGYPAYKNGTLFAGGIPYFASLHEENGFLIDLDSIPEDIAQRAKIIWTNYPNAPTGVSAPRSWLDKLVAWANKYNVIIAADEGCYNELYFKDKPHSILELQTEGVITFYSLSKRNNMTGYRVGFIAGDQRLVESYKKVKTFIDSGTPTFIQDVAALALQDTQHVQMMRKEYQAKREILIPAFCAAGFVEPAADATFYLWLQAANGQHGLEVASKLLDLGIVVIPGVGIADEVDGRNPAENFIRVALVTSMSEVEDAAKIIRQSFKLN